MNLLKHCGDKGIATKLINRYHSNRQQYVQLEEINSEQQSINCGIPQGSILYPRLFIIYINDLCNVSIIKNALFADDTTIFHYDNDTNSIGKTVSVELEDLHTWFNVNRLSLYIGKTYYMLFSNNLNTDFKQCANSKYIKKINVTKFLGVFIGDKLNRKDHVSNISNK